MVSSKNYQPYPELPDLYNKTGWSQAQYITVSGGGGTNPTPGPNPTNPPGSGVIINGLIKLSSGSVNVRQAPNTSSAIVRSLTHNYPVCYDTKLLNSTGSDGNTWYKITYPTNGYVASQYVKSGGNAGASISNYPGCPNCGKAMQYDPLRLVSHTYNQWDAKQHPTGGVWYPATGRYVYTCSSHPTPAGTIIDGPGIKGYVWGNNPNNFYNVPNP